MKCAFICLRRVSFGPRIGLFRASMLRVDCFIVVVIVQHKINRNPGIVLRCGKDIKKCVDNIIEVGHKLSMDELKETLVGAT